MKRAPLLRGLVAVALGAALEAGVSLLFWADWLDDVALVTALGVLIAVLVGAAGGLWAGVAVALAGWTLQLFLVADDTWRHLITLPAWLVAAAAAGWLAWRLRARGTERTSLSGQLSALRAGTRDAVIALDREGTVQAWNDAAEAIYGYSASEALGRPLADLVGDANLAEISSAGERVAKDGVRHRRKDGETAIVRVTATLLGDDQTLVVANDSTELTAARAQAEALEARYESLAGQLPGATYIHPLGNREKFVHVSPQVGTMVGYRAQDWVTDSGLFFRLVHEEDRERVREEVRRAGESATPLRLEYRMLARNGAVAWVRDEAAVVRGSSGEPLYVQGYLQDITTEQEARSDRESLRAAARASASEATERQQRLDLLSRASVALTATPEREAALRRTAELAVEGLADWCIVDFIDEQGTVVRAAVARGQADPLVGAPAAEPEPTVLDVIRTAEPELSEARICVPMVARGRTLGAITLLAADGARAYGSDDLALAEHLARLAALAVDNARLHQQVQEGADAAHVLTYVADGVFLVDRAGVIRLWNPTVQAITGLEAKHVVGRQAADVIPDWSTLAARIPVGGAEPVQPETLPIETEYGERWISISGVEFFDGVVYALRDLTESRRLEQLKAEFVATASHELRTPLAAVYGAAQTLRRHDFALDEGGRERFVSLIVEESERLGRIVNDILLANQLDVGALDLRSETFDPKDLVERVVEAARAHAPPAITVEAAPGPPPPPLASDRDRLRQVLVNLVENAIKYSPEGGRVEVGATPAGDMVRFYVRDQGLGVPVEEQKRIFDKFYRLDPNMTAGVGGTGLGLYICDELVRRMGGRIWVESDGEIGSTFLFEIPANDNASSRPAVREVIDASSG